MLVGKTGKEGGNQKTAVKRHNSGEMTEKTEGSSQERHEGGGGGQEHHQQPPRTYSDFMRNLAAKYNTDNRLE